MEAPLISQLTFIREDFTDPGLYILFKDDNSYHFSPKVIEQLSQEYWGDENKISEKTKGSFEFAKCGFCPDDRSSEICNGLKPLLPLIEMMEKYMSYEEVTAVFRNTDKSLIVKETTLQVALDYITMLSIMEYCEMTGTFSNYFDGVNPFSNRTVKQTCHQIYLNILHENQGNIAKTIKELNFFAERLKSSSNNRIRRLNLITTSDALANSFVRNTLSAQLLNLKAKNLEKMLEKVQDEQPEEAIEEDILNLNYPAIDREHQALLVDLAQLEKLINQQDNPAILNCLVEIFNHIKAHFAHEEDLMKTVKYEYQASHISRHNKLLTLLEEYAQSVTEGEVVSLDFLRFCLGWVTEHIIGMDRDLVNCLQKAESEKSS